MGSRLLAIRLQGTSKIKANQSTRANAGTAGRIRLQMESIRRELRKTVLIVVTLWIAFFVIKLSPLSVQNLALRPRTVRGLLGIATMPLVHENLRHLLNNTWPLLVLLGIVAVSRRNVWRTAITVVAMSGAILWLFGRGADHVGASSLVFGLMAFLVATGYFDRKMSSIVISVAVGLLYGTTFLWGILPLKSGVSWDGHLSGGIAGILAAYLPMTARARNRRRTPVEPG